jgi:hypothetical protein
MWTTGYKRRFMSILIDTGWIFSVYTNLTPKNPRKAYTRLRSIIRWGALHEPGKNYYRIMYGAAIDPDSLGRCCAESYRVNE